VGWQIWLTGGLIPIICWRPGRELTYNAAKLIAQPATNPPDNASVAMPCQTDDDREITIGTITGSWMNQPRKCP
jgi:hypothetical protein